MENNTGPALDSASMDELLAEWKTRRQALIEETLAVQSIPAPTFHEAARADYIAGRFSSIGLRDVSQDHVHNVYGRIAGADRAAPCLLISAHMDTVFPPGTPLESHYDAAHDRLYGPGIGDNSLSIAAMIALGSAFRDHGIVPAVDILFAATACEEGLGNLIGIRQVMASYPDSIGAALILEGSCFGNIINAGLAIKRFRLRIEGPGGHSWAESSAPSAVHTLVRVAAALTERVSLPRLPRTTLNIGLIEGGISVNTRAPSASMTIDLRSEDPDTLQLVTNDVYALFETFMTEPELTFTTEMVGERPGGRLDDQHPLVREAVSIYTLLGVRNVRPTISSTDANLLFNSGIPTICIGISTGGDAHSMGEYINTRPIPSGMAALTALAIRTAGALKHWGCCPSGSQRED